MTREDGGIGSTGDEGNEGGPAGAKKPDGAPEAGALLRERAEQLLAIGDARAWAQQLSEQDALRLVHELQVHQIELEMQNEELRRAQVELVLSAERYADLYDFAPVGYLSITPEGTIVRANLTVAAMLGMPRQALIGKPTSSFITAEFADHFYLMRRRLVLPEMTESVDLRLQPRDGEPFWARLEIITRYDPADGVVLWQMAISNIDPQKRAELMLQRLNEELDDQVHRRTQQLTLTNTRLVEEIDLRRRAEEELRVRENLLERRVAARTAELATLLSVARDISSTLDIDAILEIILAELQRIVNYSGCAIFLIDGQMLTLVAYNGPLPRGGLVQSQTTLEDSPLLRVVIDDRRPVIVPDMLADTPLTTRWRKHAGSLQRQLLNRSHSWMGIPMIAQGQVIGVLRLDHEQPEYFTEQDAGLVLTLASQAAIAVVNARLYEQALRVAALEERQRLARELHDSVAQTFYSIALAAHSARAQLDQNPNTTERRLVHILDLAEAGLTEMKALIFDLRAEGIRRDGLVEALRRHVDALGARNDIRVSADLGVEPDAPLPIKEAIYGIAREALQNTVRHANATELALKLSHSEDVLSIEVRDNGQGFTPEQTGLNTLGLRSMRERATAAGGSIEITSKPGGGAVVRAQVPLRARIPGKGREASDE